MTSKGPSLSAVFVDYDNIYLSLKRKNDEAAKRFAKDAGLWLSAIASGRLVTPTNTLQPVEQRRIVMSRCYGNPVPRRNNNDNSTDMNSFPFVRHHFLRSGFEAIDCPPLTAQLKNSADIRMVMDVRDYLTHDTYFEEFVILSGDADFTPVLHRLRAHARRTVIFANDHTAAPYTAIADGEIRESHLISLLLEGRMSEAEPNNATQAIRSTAELESWGRDIVAEVVDIVRSSGQPVPLEALADRAVRALGHDKTSGSGWGGNGTFRELLIRGLPKDFRLSSEPPYYVYDASRQIAPPGARTAPRPEPRGMPGMPQPQPSMASMSAGAASPPRRMDAPPPMPKAPAQPATGPAPVPAATTASMAGRPVPPPQPQPFDASRPGPVSGLSQQRPIGIPAEAPTAMQQSIARIYEACQAPALSPAEYRVLFDCMAQEIAANGPGAQTLGNIAQRAQATGIEIRNQDVRFVLEVVSEADPWFEQGASAALFASRFCNFVIARCRAQGLNLSVDELDLIEQWFKTANPGQRGAPAYGRMPASVPPPARSDQGRAQPPPIPQQQPQATQQAAPQMPPPPPAAAAAAPPAPSPSASAPAPAESAQPESVTERWWNLTRTRSAPEPAAEGTAAEDLPRAAQARNRG